MQIQTINDWKILKTLINGGGQNNLIPLNYGTFDMNPKTFFQRIKKMERKGQIEVVRDLGFKNLYKVTNKGVEDFMNFRP